MSFFAWFLSVLIVALALLYVSPKLRKTAFIWSTYVTLTGWYYFRLWEKKRARTAAGSASSAANATSPTVKNAKAEAWDAANSAANSSSIRRSVHSVPRSQQLATNNDDDDIEDVVYFESRERLSQQRELRHASEQSQSQSRRRMSHSSSSGNSGYSDDSLGKLQQQPPKTHLGIFRHLRRKHGHHHHHGSHAHAVESDDVDATKHRSSDASPSVDVLASSTVSEGGATTRRTYTGRRKKPQSWAD